MEKLVIQGGTRLSGKVKIGGAKNSAVAILPATLLADSGVFEISNLPNIEDIHNLQKTIEYLGGTVTKVDNSTFKIDNSTINTFKALNEETGKMRASYYLLGPILSRFNEVEINFPGGCSIGARPIDLHLKALTEMGATTEVTHGVIKVSAPQGLHGATIFFDTVTVGATINVMLAAVKAKGTTVIKNAAKEPHVIDIAELLNKMGAKVSGAGTDTIEIIGVDHLTACSHSVVPDQIEAGTYMIAAVATKGDIIVSNVNPSHLEFLTKKLSDMGAHVEVNNTSIRVACSNRANKTDIKTAPYPGFPTDLQQPMSLLLGIADGRSMVIENIWENRFKHLNELQKMGIRFKVEGNIAIIDGIDSLSGTEVSATDLRGGAAMVIAGLVADGTTTIDNIIHIDRGYEDVEHKFNSLGANITRVKC